MVLAAFSRKLNYANLRDVVLETGKTTGRILFVAIGATCFSVIFKRIGGDGMIVDTVMALSGGNPWGTLGVVLGLIFILGFFLEWIEISYIALPLFAPIIALLDFGLGMTPSEQMTWFAIMLAVSLQTSFLTPPFGYALFYLKGIAPPELTMADIMRAIIPFVVVQLIGLALVVAFPSLVLWLPGYMTG